AAKNGHTSTVRALFNRNSASIEIQDHNGSTPLSLATCGASKNHAETVKFLVESGANVSYKQRNGSTPIITAAENGNVQSMKYLLGKDCLLPGKEPANVDERNSGRSTALSLAAKNGHEDAVLLLLSHGAQDISKKESPGRRGPISWAAGHGMVEAVKKLQSMSNILTNAFDKEDRTPLSWAAGNGHTAVVSQLLLPIDQTTPGAAVNSIDTAKRTPLSWAAGAGHKEVVQVLLSHRADQNIRGKNTASPIVWAAKGGHLDVLKILLGEDPPDETMLGEDGGSLLLVAAANGRAEVVSFLLQQAGTDVNKTDRNGRTPLIHTALGGHEDVAAMLLQHHADVHQRTNNTGATVLTVAASWGRLDIIKLLLAHDRSTLQVTTDEDDNTPLYLAVQRGHLETVKFLLHSGCSVEAGSRDGDTLAHVAARGGYFLVLKALFEHERQFLNAKNANRETPLLLAAEKSHELCVVVILELNSITLKQKMTPLMFASRLGSDHVVGLLLEHGADFRLRDRDYCTALSLAVVGGHIGTVLRLLDVGAPYGMKDKTGATLLILAAKRGHSRIVHLLL
ncbi:ankyrin repeat-containing domain protein, partial [Rhexocercosporidium sp. MPI-PUGE-AT-0058]